MGRKHVAWALAAASLALSPATRGQAPAGVADSGEQVFSGVCAACHEKDPSSRAPARAVLGLMSTESIYRALTAGAMKPVGDSLSDAQKRDVAQYITKRPFGIAVAPPLMCSTVNGRPGHLSPLLSGWGFDAGNSHFIPDDLTTITRANVGTLKLKWALSFPNAVRARSQPAVTRRAILVGSQDGTVFALDRVTGCAFWTFKARAEVRTGLILAPVTKQAGGQLVYFGDLTGYAYALDAATGRLRWQARADTHPAATITGTPSLSGNLLYVPVSSLEEAMSSPTRPCCTFRGSVVALDARTGSRRWQTFMSDLPKPTGKTAAGVESFGPSGAAIWNSPTVDRQRGRIYFGTGDNYSEPTTKLSDAIVALDARSGRVAWSNQTVAGDIWPGDGPDSDWGASPVLTTSSDGRQWLVAAQKSGWVFGMNPADGQVIWRTKVGRGGVGGGVQFGIAVAHDTVFVPIHDRADGRTYVEPPRPGIYALDIRTGKPVWSAPLENTCAGKTACYPGYAGAISATAELVFAGSIDGYLRAYDSATGKVLWQFDTAREFRGVNGETARGGSMAGGGAPIVLGNQLIMNSGYAAFNATQKAGNVLLMFEVEPAQHHRN